MSKAQAARGTTQGASDTQKAGADIAQMATELHRLVTELQAANTSQAEDAQTRRPARRPPSGKDAFKQGPAHKGREYQTARE